MAGFRTPFHLGGPLGLAGLATLAGATGLFVLAGSPEDRDEPAVPLSGMSERESGSQVDTRVDRGESPLVGVLPEDIVPDDVPTEPPLVQPEQAPPAVITAQAKGAEVTFIVQLFRRDKARLPDAARHRAHPRRHQRCAEKDHGR